MRRTVLSQIKESYSYSRYREKMQESLDTNSRSGKGKYLDGGKYARFNSFCMDRMEKEHRMADTIFDRIKKLANNYNAPAGAGDSCKAIYQKLKDFEDSLHGCIYLENNVLFPKAIKIEEELLNNEQYNC